MKFIMFLFTIIHVTLSMLHHSFADKLQLQMSAPVHTSCLLNAVVHNWNKSLDNKIKLNENKTMIKLVTSERATHIHNMCFSIINIYIYVVSVCLMQFLSAPRRPTLASEVPSESS